MWGRGALWRGSSAADCAPGRGLVQIGGALYKQAATRDAMIAQTCMNGSKQPCGYVFDEAINYNMI